MPDHPALAAEHLSKRFGATSALSDVSLALHPGKMTGLVGENGAGKSTLIRLLGGVHRPDAGCILLDGTPLRLAAPRDAIRAGIVTIPQELRLVEPLSVAENIMLPGLPSRRLGPLPDLNRRALHAQAAAVLRRLAHPLDPDCRVGTLGYADRQMVAIARSLHGRARVLILDEPTAALEAREVARLHLVLRELRRDGVALLYVSHRLAEIADIADTCIVLRDGRVAAHFAQTPLDPTAIAAAMTGPVIHPPANAPRPPGPERLATATLSVRAGEILGLAGLLGSGAAAALRALFGTRGAIRLRRDGHDLTVASPAQAIAAGLGFIPGERRAALLPLASVRDNILLPSLDRAGRPWHLPRHAAATLVDGLIAALDIRPRDPQRRAGTLSGGNQQKLLLARWLARDIALLLLEEPTAGVDIGAKARIHAALQAFAARGGGIVLTSGDLPELRALADTLLCYRDGAIAARLPGGAPEAALREAIGG